MRPVPAGRQRGQCCTPYSRLQEEIDNVETIAVTANNTANNAMNAATIQAGNAAQSAQDAQDSADAAAASAAAVAGALDDKVDKLTTANLKAYTHNGSTQGEKAVAVDGTTADSIPIRDANGYVQGATNTTGIRDNVLTNGTRVQNDLDNYASMVRTTGNQTIGGTKTFDAVMTVIPNLKGHESFNSNSIDIRAVYRIPLTSQTYNINVLVCHRYGITLARLSINNSGVPSTGSKIDTLNSSDDGLQLGIVDDDGKRYICYKGPSSHNNFPQTFILPSFYAANRLNATLDNTTFNSGDVTFKSFGLWD